MTGVSWTHAGKLTGLAGQAVEQPPLLLHQSRHHLCARCRRLIEHLGHLEHRPLPKLRPDSAHDVLLRGGTLRLPPPPLLLLGGSRAGQFGGGAARPPLLVGLDRGLFARARRAVLGILFWELAVAHVVHVLLVALLDGRLKRARILALCALEEGVEGGLVDADFGEDGAEAER
jgi:hypothetical protein